MDYSGQYNIQYNMRPPPPPPNVPPPPNMPPPPSRQQNYDPYNAFEIPTPRQPPPPPSTPFDPYNPFEDENDESNTVIPPPPSDIPPPPSDIPPPPPVSDDSRDSRIPNSSSSSIENSQLQIDSEKAKILKIEQEKLEHDRLIMAENSKRNKLVKPVTSFIKPKKIKGFDIEDDDDGIVESKVNTTDKNDSLTKSENKSSTSVSDSSANSNNELSSELTILVKKTAAWVVDNPEKAQILLEKSRGNEQMVFLYDRHTPAGALYIQELSRYKAEKDVHDIFHGTATTISQSNGKAD